jgi:hypothetical protein
MRLNNRGQFFSPDMIIAMSVFVFSLLVFFSASNAVFNDVSIFEDRKLADESAHLAMNSMLLSSGEPWNWETLDFSSVSLFGLSFSPNVIEPAKVVMLANLLNNDVSYLQTRVKLGLGAYDLYFRVSDSDGATIIYNGSPIEGGKLALNPKLKFSYKRLVIFNSSNSVFEVILSAAG